MVSISEIARTLGEIPGLLRLGLDLKPRPRSTHDSLASRMEDTVARFGELPAVVFEGQTVTWNALNALANRYAGALKALGLQRGDKVSVIMENRVEFVATVVALNKLGAAAALINTNLTGKPLIHCMSISDSRLCIFGEERQASVSDVRTEKDLSGIVHYLFVPDSGESPCPSWASDLAAAAKSESPENPVETGECTLGDIALNIFTSGTTGLPKAAVMSNRRLLQSAMGARAGGLRCDENDCIYLCLPLYHGTGLFLGVGASLLSGATMFIRRKFSASNFLPEIREHGATHFIYIGELCRYLLQVPRQPDDADNTLRTIMGNGLRPDIWHEFKQRFGIERISEFYGASEGNIAFFNVFNKDCTVGTTSVSVALVKYDVDADEIVRDDEGWCTPVVEGEPGLLLGEITEETVFEGYTNKDATESKILRDVFEPGDAWFNTGDLLKTIDVGFALGMKHYQFVDRVGDTFRWMSENVSTSEVGEIIDKHPQVALCNVYGVEVPGTNGRAGMAALSLSEGESELDLAGFSEHVNRELPAYARPVFVRVLHEMETTGTFKMVKGDLRKENYDLEQVTDPLYVLKPRSQGYEPLDAEFAAMLRAGEAGY
jgi:citronellyl-CoA synthetase